MRVIYRTAATTLIFIMSLFLLTAQAQEQEVPNPQQEIHSNLVKSALLNDAFAERCRGMSIDKNFNQVNRLFITKYGVSANNYIETFIAEDFRDYKRQFSRHFNIVLAKKGGCQAAKDQKWDKEMHDEFKELYRQAEASNWFPIIEY